MGCRFCGEDDQWIKTCLVNGSRIQVCETCYEALLPRPVIVPGESVITTRCDQCGRYSNPREMAKVSPGGRKDAYSGTCGTCAAPEAVGSSRVVLHPKRSKRNTVTAPWPSILRGGRKTP
jgi:hypothetical protein